MKSIHNFKYWSGQSTLDLSYSCCKNYQTPTHILIFTNNGVSEYVNEILHLTILWSHFFICRDYLALNVYVALCYYKLDYYDVSQVSKGLCSMKTIHCREPILFLWIYPWHWKKKVKNSFKKFFLKSPLQSYVSFLGH